MKRLFVINGSGGVGKDTFVSFLSEYFKTVHVSIADKVKYIATKIGWDGRKTERDRKFLSDLKALIDTYNDANYKRVRELAKAFLNDSENEIFVVDMREKDQIQKFVKEFDAKTILITRSSVKHIKSNVADAGVFCIKYDYQIKNDGTLGDLKSAAAEFAKCIKEQNSKRKVVYISHPFGGDTQNILDVERIVKELQKQYPNYIFISPLHFFGFMYNDVSYKVGLDMTIWLLDKCDEMWIYGKDFYKSRGCMGEIEYCKKNKIPYYVMEEYN